MLEAWAAADMVVLYAINVAGSNAILDVLMPLISHLGSLWLWTPLVLLIHYYRRFLGRRLIFGLISSSAIVVFLKELVLRPRPEDLLQNINVLDKEPFGSFPSGHAATAFMAAFLLSRVYPKYKWHLYGLATLVGLTRIYLGMHFPTDVLAGALLGLGIGYAVVRLLPEEKRRLK